MSCTSKTFKFVGILCRHIFQVFQQGVLEVPPQYILPRRRKDVKVMVILDTINETNELDVDVIKTRRGNIL